MNKSIEPENSPVTTVRVTMADVRRWEFAAERQKVVDDYCEAITMGVMAILKPQFKELEEKLEVLSEEIALAIKRRKP